MSFESYLNEKEDDSLWRKQIQNEFDIAKDKHFKSALVSFGSGAMSKNTMFGRLYLISDRKDQSHGYYDNDILGLNIIIEKIGDDEYSVEYDYTSITTVPTQQYMAFGTHKVSTRAYKGDIKKIAVNTDKLFAKYKAELVKLKNDGMLPLMPSIINKYV